MAELRTTSCCGILDLHGVSFGKPQEVVDSILPFLAKNSNLWSREKPFIMFTSAKGGRMGAVNTDYCTAFANYIEQNNLGTVMRNVAEGQNWTGNVVGVWFWRPNYQILKDRYNRLVASGMLPSSVF